MLLYRILISVCAPVFAGVAVIRWLRGTEDRSALAERLGLAGRTEPADRPGLWIHGASNGELASARVLIEQVQKRYPKYALLITCNTLSARRMVQGWGLPDTTVRLAPLDLRWLAERLIRAHDIRALMIIENEFWPNRFFAAARTGLPVIVAGARISGRSARKWARFGGLSRTVLETVRVLSAQDGDSQDRFVGLGLPKGRIAPRVDLKALYVRPTPGPAPALPDWPREDTWLAASTHPGEEAMVIAAHRALLDERPGLRLILAPRHPRRADEVAALLRQAGLRFVRRSDGAPAAADTQVLLADTMGEMPLWYAAASVALVGGSLADHGGHTPYEPAAFGMALLHGPHVSNFAAAYGNLEREGGAAPVEDAAALTAALRDALQPDRQGTLARAARRALSGVQNLNALLERLDPLLR